MKKLILPMGAFIAVSAAAAVPAEAKPTSDRPLVVIAEPEPLPPTRRVGYADLNLATQIGERTLVRRVRSAVGEVCEEEVGPSPLFYYEHSCRVLTWKDTRPQVERAIARARAMAAAGSPDITAAAIVVRAAE